MFEMFHSVLLVSNNDDPGFTPCVVVCQTSNDEVEVRRMADIRSLNVSTITRGFIYLNDFPS
jgi:hypothetical protein